MSAVKYVPASVVECCRNWTDQIVNSGKGIEAAKEIPGISEKQFKSLETFYNCYPYWDERFKTREIEKESVISNLVSPHWMPTAKNGETPTEEEQKSQFRSYEGVEPPSDAKDKYTHISIITSLNKPRSRL